jgi:hypothetical protein
VIIVVRLRVLLLLLLLLRVLLIIGPLFNLIPLMALLLARPRPGIEKLTPPFPRLER